MAPGRLWLGRGGLELVRAGVEKNRSGRDTGAGFGKTGAQNFARLARQREVLAAGDPLLAAW